MLDSRRKFEIKVKLDWTALEVLLRQQLFVFNICIQRVLYGNEIAQYFQNYKGHESGKGHSRKPL